MLLLLQEKGSQMMDKVSNAAQAAMESMQEVHIRSSSAYIHISDKCYGAD